MNDKTVLIVEDDERLREMYSAALTLEGCTVQTAQNGQIGVQAALASHPDIILMDIAMPIMDGHDATDEIRKDDWGKDAKIIYLTNQIEAEHLVKALDRGSSEYIVKSRTPINELVDKVKEVLRS
ncbi:response regulator [bacterium]|nr:response regulator [bacterium]